MPVYKVQVRTIPGKINNLSAPRVEDGAVWRRVRRVDVSPSKQTVYNMAVEVDQSYVAEGVGVHNCSWARLEYARITKNAEYRCAVRHMKYKAKTVADMRVLYTSIDRGAPRTAGNVINAHLAGTPGFIGVPRNVISLLASGLAYWLESPGTKFLLDPDTKAVYMQTKYKDVTMAVKDFLTAPGRRNADVWVMFKRAPVCAALFETFNKLPSRAGEFWEVVASGVGVVAVSDPRFKLRERLKSSSLRSRGVGRREKADAEDMFSWCVNAWNAWRAGKEVQLLKGGHGTGRSKAK